MYYLLFIYNSLISKGGSVVVVGSCYEKLGVRGFKVRLPRQCVILQLYVYYCPIFVYLCITLVALDMDLYC